MEKVDFREDQCPIARALAVVGEWWSLLILRDALIYEITRFTDFQRSLGISRNALTVRLDKLVECGVLERQAVEDSPRTEYALTDRGRALAPVLQALNVWGEEWLETPKDTKRSRTKRPPPNPRVPHSSSR